MFQILVRPGGLDGPASVILFVDIHNQVREPKMMPINHGVQGFLIMHALQDVPEISVKDYEFVESYSLEGYDGPVMYNSEEVSEVAWVSIPEVAQRMKNQPDDFTPWFLNEAHLLGWLNS